MSVITDNISKLLDQLPEHVTLVTVTKTRSSEEIMEAYNMGLRLFGENRVQELVQKQSSLPEDISWHLIGHLQTNKVKQAVSAATMIESADSLRLLRLLNNAATAGGEQIDLLLQVHIAGEMNKTGFSVAEMEETDWAAIVGSLNAVRICGLMGMASFTDDMKKVREEFRTLVSLFRQLREAPFAGSIHFRELSMGMTGDWQIAVEEGSTMVRLGTLIFGERKNM